MLMTLLPGLRELRTPLATGYIWIACLWLGAPLFGLHIDLATEPTTEPFASIWSIGKTVGPAACFAMVSFAAYLIGSFLEISPESLWARLTAVEVGDRRKLREFGSVKDDLDHDADLLSRADLLTLDDQRLRASLSTRAGRDLFEYIMSRSEQDELPTALLVDRAAKILDEEPQLVTRLLVLNKELYERYDRFMAESTLRLNLGLPLIVLAVLLFSQSDHEPRTAVLLTFAVLACYTLMRQGNQRAVMARDVLVQALSIDTIKLESRQATRVSESTYAEWSTFHVLELSRRQRAWREARRLAVRVRNAERFVAPLILPTMLVSVLTLVITRAVDDKADAFAWSNLLWLLSLLVLGSAVTGARIWVYTLTTLLILVLPRSRQPRSQKSYRQDYGQLFESDPTPIEDLALDARRAAQIDTEESGSVNVSPRLQAPES